MNKNIHPIFEQSWVSFRYQDIFDIKKGKRLTKLNMREGHFPFIGATEYNNGVTAKIGQEPIHDGNVISVTYNGSIGEAFYQEEAFWASDDVNVLYPKEEMFTEFNKFIALFLIPLIKLEKYRFNYGLKWHSQRMNNTIINLPVDHNGMPDVISMKNYITGLLKSDKMPNLNGFEIPFSENYKPSLADREWVNFKYENIFTIKRGKAGTIPNSIGKVRFVSSTEKSNGVKNSVEGNAVFSKNSITISNDGSVGEAFYQDEDFIASTAATVLENAHLNQYSSMFLISIIKMEKNKFNYGRKWGIEKMKKSIIKLPVDDNGNPDWQFMEDYIKSLPYSSTI